MKCVIIISCLLSFSLLTDGQVIGSVSGSSQTNGDGSITITATVAGGSPLADTFTWTLPDSSTITPGQTSGSFSASNAQVINSNTKQFTLTMADGLTSTAQSLEFRAEAGTSGGPSWSSYITFSFPAESIAGSVTGSLTQNSGVITIVAEVVGGTPAPTDYQWTVQQPDGSFQTFPAGQAGSGSTAVVTNANGNPSTTLTVSSSASIVRSFRLYVTSEDSNGNVRWWASRNWFA